LKDFVTNNITTILKHCGYSLYNEKDHKKPYNLIVVNLISPRVDYNSHSKSNINLEPFAKIFANEFYKFCKSPNNKKNNNNPKTTDNNTYHLRIWLNERWEAVKKDPALLTTGRVTLDGGYYRLRTRLDRLGIPIRDRDYIKTQIREICEKEMGLKRAELGIIAAERAQFYYKGRTYGVRIDEISELAKYATDIVIIEKQGAVEALAPFADKQGIALLYTREFSTEYALELTERTDSNIIVLTDLDASGLLIQTKLPDNKPIYRVGVNQEMLDYFGLDFDEVSETYKPEEHYDTVAEYLKNNNYNLISKDLFKRLKTERVEIDSILSKVSNKDFWDYIIEFLKEKFPNRNYNRSIDVPKSVTPIYLQKFIDNINQIIIKAQEPERQKIVNELEYTEGLFDELEDKENEIEDRLRSIVENNQEIKNKISEEFKKVFIN
jgi:hypothetical protein